VIHCAKKSSSKSIFFFGTQIQEI